jgi:hypothetical protein
MGEPNHPNNTGGLQDRDLAPNKRRPPTTLPGWQKASKSAGVLMDTNILYRRVFRAAGASDMSSALLIDKKVKMK